MNADQNGKTKPGVAILSAALGESDNVNSHGWYTWDELVTKQLNGLDGHEFAGLHNPLDLTTLVAGAVTDWIKQNGDEVRRKIFKELDSKLVEFSGKALGLTYRVGFGSSSGSFELDTYNSAKAPLLDKLRTLAEVAAGEWLNNNCFLHPPKLSEKERIALRKEFVGYYKAAIRDQIRHRATAAAKTSLDKFLNNVGKTLFAQPCTVDYNQWISFKKRQGILDECRVLQLAGCKHDFEPLKYDDGCDRDPGEEVMQLTDDLETPGTTVVYLVEVTTNIAPRGVDKTETVKAKIVTDGDFWMPAYSSNPIIVGRFGDAKSEVFYNMTEADFQLIKRAVTAWNDENKFTEQADAPASS